MLLHIAQEKPGLYQVSVLEVLYMIRTAWHSVTPNTLANCFRHARFTAATTDAPDATAEQDRDQTDVRQNLSVQLQNAGIEGVDIEAYINIDASLQTTGELTLQELAATATNQVAERRATPLQLTNENTEESSDDETEPPRVPSAREAREAVENLRSFLHSQALTDSDANFCTDAISGIDKILTQNQLGFALSGMKQSSLLSFLTPTRD
jgi:hypothetical protein